MYAECVFCDATMVTFGEIVVHALSGRAHFHVPSDGINGRWRYREDAVVAAIARFNSFATFYDMLDLYV